MSSPLGRDIPPNTFGANVTALRGLNWDAIAAQQAPRVPWDVFINSLDWRQGEHVGLVGPNGQGKTTLLIELLPIRQYVTVFATKPRDSTLDRLVSTGYRKLEKWENLPASKVPRRVLWPNARLLNSEIRQREVFLEAFGNIYREGGWCTVIDEGFYVAEILKLKGPMRTFWTQARSLGISFTVCTQRPAWVPLEMYSESTHLFFWRTTEDNAVRRLSTLGGSADSMVVKYLVQRLERHQCLYVNTRTGQMMRTRAPAPQAERR